MPAREFYYELIVERALIALRIEHAYQHSIRGTPYIADFFIARGRVILEIDGPEHLRNPRIVERDVKRDAACRALGCRVVRLTNDEVSGPGLRQRLLDALGQSSP